MLFRNFTASFVEQARAERKGTSSRFLANGFSRVRLKEGELIPEGFRLLVGSENAEVSDLVSMLVQPRGSGFFESAVEDVPVA